MTGARTWIEVDLEAVRANLRELRGRVPRGTGVVAVLKADAYGLGAPGVASGLEGEGLRAFALGTAEEAAELSRAGIRTPLLVLGPLFGEELVEALRRGWEVVISSWETLRELLDTVRRIGVRARAHVKVDTGLHRLGFAPDETLRALRILVAEPEVEVVGLMTHLGATAGARDPRAGRQNEALAGLARRARTEGLLSARAQVHGASSAALLSGLAPVHDLVRPGLALFGVLPHPSLERGALRPVLTWRARVIQTRRHPPGARVGYGGRFRTRRTSLLATVAVGYEDGLPRRSSGRGVLLLRGRPAPIVGEVSMDYVTLDATEIPGTRPGDLVTLVGRDGEAEIRVEDRARSLDTIPHEVLCGLGRRVRRVLRDAPPRGSTGEPPEQEVPSPIEPCASSSTPS